MAPSWLIRSLLAVRKYAAVWRWMTVLHPRCDAAGRIHADSVKAPVRFSEEAGGIRTSASAPSKRRASP